MKVTIFTQVYNARPYLRQCIESVLNQTFSDFEYILINNGSTDGSADMLREYAEKDDRIRLFSFDVNKAEARWLKIVREHGRGEYITDVDPDDWLEPDYLERLVDLAETHRADVVCTGSWMHNEGTGAVGKREAGTRLVFDKSRYAELFPYYHVFFRTYWAKLFRMEVFLQTTFPDFDSLGTSYYGSDTLISFSILRQARRVCVDDSLLHHYRIYQQSVSYRYDPCRSHSDDYLYHDAMDFLSAYGPVSDKNRQFVSLVYANAISDTVTVLDGAKLPDGKKLEEYRRVAERPATAEAFRLNHEDAARARKALLGATLRCVPDEASEADYRRTVGVCIPRCADAVTPANAGLFRAAELLDVLARDDAEALLAALLDLIREQKHTKKYDVYAMVKTLAGDRALLQNVDDKSFLRHYGDVYLAVWRERYAEALDAMTGVLLDGGKANEAFLQLYLSLAALQNQAPAFVFGKTRLAALRLRQGDREACRALLRELDEMGAGGVEEVEALRRELNRRCSEGMS